MPPTDDIDAVRQKLTHAEAVIAELRGVVANLRKQVEAQQAHIHRLVKRTFGRGGERVEGPTLFDGIDPPEAEVPPPVQPPTPEQPAPRKRKGHGRRRKPADLPRRREEIDLSDAEKMCACCGTAKIRIGQIVSERLDYQPMALFVRELVRPTYACRSCESQGHDPQIARAVLPPEPIPKSGIGSGLLAHVIVSKMVDHLPLHRQESILARHGWDVCRSTLCDHLKKCGELLTPLYDLMHRRLLQSFAIHADDTPLVLLRPRRSAFAWVYLGDAANPYTLFDLTAGRRQEFPQAFLGGYRGFVHADAYDGYNGVHDHVRHLGCWMHARRYFVEAEPSDPRAIEALAFVRTLYAVERAIQDERDRPGSTFTDADVVRVRRTRAGPILAAFADWLDVQHRCSTPKSLFGQAVGYARNQWASLVRYVDDARFAIDNGAAERAIRPLAIGRANWLHVGGDGGLKTASVLLSVCASATRHRLNPWAYLRDVLDLLTVRPDSADLSDLLPDAKTRRYSRTD
ncbi:IS66 family transposase [Frigoriglobus tundricola]|uniref:Mobile element protein n=1 Tax=Frigoriglobus tundricola TaxID=2774151 RepID=A0A6M5Z4U1_9BACT|nr:IS66 family transposase [Frigoriglobus tundricola]QJX01066.1 Mobile element protein [Frigoriglobus tundricola]